MLVDSIERRSIVFTYMPAEFSESKAADWQNVNILGRSEPIVSYAWSGPRLFNLTLFFIAHGESNIETEVLAPVRLIRSWVYPIYSSQQRTGSATRIATPPYILFIVGNWLRQRCILLNYDLTYKAPWARKDLSPVQTSSPGNTSSVITDVFGNVIGEQSIQPGQPTFDLDSPTDTLMPYIAEIRLTMQEVNENIPNRSPFDTMQVRRGDDKLTDLSILDTQSPGSNG